VATRRKKLGIPAHGAKEPRIWTRKEDLLLGSAPDKELAKMLGRDRSTVTARRIKLGIARHRPYPAWTPELDALVGTLPDKDLAAQLGRSIETVRLRRYQLRRPPCNPKWKPWTPEEEALLGTMRDEAVAKHTGHSVESIKQGPAQAGHSVLCPFAPPVGPSRGQSVGDTTRS
jgi:hypothetical protein